MIDQRTFLRFATLLGIVIVPSLMADDLPNAAAPVHTHGTVVIKTLQFETMVIVRSGDGNGEGNDVFHMWSKPALQVDGGYRDVGVDYSGTSLSLLFIDAKKALTFTVAGASASCAGLPPAFSATVYTVAGLSHEVGPGAARHAVRAGGPTPFATCDTGCEEAGWEQPDPWNTGAGGSSCTSGGPFSTSCTQRMSSGASCTVTCGNGTYACCIAGNPPTCSCKIYG
jgi:hypothetical protein